MNNKTWPPKRQHQSLPELPPHPDGKAQLRRNSSETLGKIAHAPDKARAVQSSPRLEDPGDDGKSDDGDGGDESDEAETPRADAAPPRSPSKALGARGRTASELVAGLEEEEMLALLGERIELGKDAAEHLAGGGAAPPTPSPRLSANGRKGQLLERMEDLLQETATDAARAVADALAESNAELARHRGARADAERRLAAGAEAWAAEKADAAAARRAEAEAWRAARDADVATARAAARLADERADAAVEDLRASRDAADRDRESVAKLARERSDSDRRASALEDELRATRDVLATALRHLPPADRDWAATLAAKHGLDDGRFAARGRPPSRAPPAKPPALRDVDAIVEDALRGSRSDLFANRGGAGGGGVVLLQAPRHRGPLSSQ